MTDARLSPNLVPIDIRNGKFTAEGFRFFQAITQAISGGGTFQPLSAILTGVSAMGPSIGLVTQIGATTFLKRTLAASSPILIANADGVAGNPTFTGDIASNAEAIAGVDTTKIIVSSALAAAILAAGAGYQPLDADLTAIAALISAADKLAYATGAGTWALTDFSAFARTILDDANAAAAQTTLGLVIGTNVQAFDADLAALAANATDGFWAHTGAGTGSARTLINTAPVQITNPAGIAGNPTISVDASTTAASGIVELATSAETITGTDTVRAVTPAGAAAAYQPLDADLTSWAGVTRAAGFDTFTATPSSANLKTLVTDETGSGGALVFATAPTLNGPIVQTNAIDLQVGQISFPATQNASAGANVLDDYEEGTWTPAFTLTGVAFTTITYSAQVGHYEKIGRQVRIFGHITVSALTVGAASGNLTITGLPFSCAVFGAPVNIGFIDAFTTNTPIHGAVSSSTISLYHRTAITTGAVTSTFAVVSATSDIYFGAVYHV